MADFRQSVFTKRKMANGNAYSDVFRGSPKCAAVSSFSSQVEDYSEIFGNFFAPRSSSIPFLDFPLLDEDQLSLDGPTPKFDYSEIFGCFDAGDFAVPYEQLFAEPPQTRNPATSFWSEDEKGNSSFVSTSLGGHDQNLFSGSKKSQSLSNNTSQHVYDGTEKFNVSYNKSNQSSQGDPSTGLTHVAQLDEVPGFTVLIDSFPSPDKSKHTPALPMQTPDGMSANEDPIVSKIEETGYQEMLPNAPLSNSTMKMGEDDISSDKKHFGCVSSDMKYGAATDQSDVHVSNHRISAELLANSKVVHLKPTAPHAPANDQHHPCTPGDQIQDTTRASSEHVVFISVSDINLQTEPSQLPPPLRPPPKLGSFKQRKGFHNELYSKKSLRRTETCHFGTGFGAHAFDAPLKSGSPPVFDVEVDASSAAAASAASAAAMRDAMEKAQATLKSAKESMERKMGGYPGWTRVTLNNDRRVKEKKENGYAQENLKPMDAEILEDWRSLQMKDSASQRRKMFGPMDVSLDLQEKRGHAEVRIKSFPEVQGDFRQSPGSHKQEDKGITFKVEKQFYQPNDEKDFRVTCDHENDETILKTSSKISLHVNNMMEAFNEDVVERDKIVEVAKQANDLESNCQKSKTLEEVPLCNANEKALNPSSEAKITDERKVPGIDEQAEETIVKASKVACILIEDKNMLQSDHDEEEKRLELGLEYAGMENKLRGYQKCEEGKRLHAAVGLEGEEKKLQATHKYEDNEKGQRAALKYDERENRPKFDIKHKEEDRLQESALKNGEEEKRPKAVLEHKEEKKRPEAALAHSEEKKGPGAAVKCEEEQRQASTLWHQEKGNGLKADKEHDKEEKRLRAVVSQGEDDNQQAVFQHKAEKKRHVAADNYEGQHMRPEEEKRGISISKNQEVEKKLEAASQEKQEEEEIHIAHVSEYEQEIVIATPEEELEGEENNFEVASLVSDGKDHGKNFLSAEKADERTVTETRSKSVKEPCEQEEHEKAGMQFGQMDKNQNLLTTFGRTHDSHMAEKEIDAVWSEGNEKLTEVQYTDASEKNNITAKAAGKVFVGKENGHTVKMENIGSHKDADSRAREMDSQAFDQKDVGDKQKVACQNGEMEAADVVLILSADEGRHREVHETHEKADNDKEPETGCATMGMEKNEKLEVEKEAYEVFKKCNISNDLQTPVMEGDDKKFKSTAEIFCEAESRNKEVNQLDSFLVAREKLLRTPSQIALYGDREGVERTMPKTYKEESKEKEETMQREKDLEKERLRKLEEEREREREREKDRIAVERATHEARDRALAEAREKAERAAVERATAEARQRAFAEARERAEKASAAERASVEAARIKAERAAVERATAEARERAAEKARAEMTAVRDKADGGIKQNPSDVRDVNGAQGESVLRCRARLERHKRTVERAAKALAEKNLRDILAQREQAERNRLAETLDADIKRWSNGKEGNLRALLSTLQYILGPESGWQPIPLTEVITAAAVKKAYRKATLCVHPDKVQQRGANIQQKYVCEKVFDLLKDAWNKFNSEER